jgi:hypothetical protein
MPKASDITRILSGWIKIGRKTINLNEDDHKSILTALFNILTSTVGNTDALESAELIQEFVSDVESDKLMKAEFFITDLVKEVYFTGADLNQLVNVWGSPTVKVNWLVERGGKRAQTKATVTKLGSLS